MRSIKFQTSRTVTSFAVFLLFIPSLLTGQPFSIRKKQTRYIEVNEYKYYDFNTVLIAKKNSSFFTIDSVFYNNSGPLSYKLSVLGKDISTIQFEKGDSVLIQFTCPGEKASKDCLIRLYYHINKRPVKEKLVIINNIQLLDSIKFEHNQ